MSRRVAETMMGGCVVAVTLIFFFYAYKQSAMTTSSDAYQLHAYFNDITGISNGSDVRIGGVKIGSVQSLGLNQETYQAKITFSVSRDVALPLDSSASIVGESLLGGKFIALAPGADEEILGHGDEIEFTQSSISLEQLLGKFVFSGGGVDDGADAASAQSDQSADDTEFTLP